MRVVAVVNQKGGCGKTTLAVNLAAALADRGQRILVIDNDPQGHATLALGFGERDFTLGTYDLYAGERLGVAQVRVTVARDLDLVPSGVELSAVEPELAGVAGRELRLRDALAPVADAYDTVLVDCPPGVGLLTFNALLAAGEALVPVDASRLSVRAAARLLETLAVIEDQRAHRVAPRLVLSAFDTRPRFARVVIGDLEDLAGDKLLGTIVYRTIRVAEAAAAGRPLVWHDPEARGARDFQLLAEEMLALADRGDAPRPRATRRPLQAATVARIPAGPAAEPGVVFRASFPAARTVRVTGTFCGWSPEGVAMQRLSDGTWECRLPLAPGDHQYRFIVDGAWQPDPANPRSVRNEFGGANSVVNVP